MFELAAGEIADMVSQNAIPGIGKLGGAPPMAFTQEGVAILSSALRSPLHASGEYRQLSGASPRWMLSNVSAG